VLANGTRHIYDRAFYGWDNEYLRPPHKVIASSSGRTSHMFYSCSNLKIVEKQYFDLTNASCSHTTQTAGHYSTFELCSNLVTIEDIGMQAGYYYRTFWGCQKLETIEIFRIEADCGIGSSCFAQCYALKNITVDGEIGASISFSGCSRLTLESLKSIITHLKDYAGTDKEFTYTLTLHSNAWASLEAEGATSPNGTLWRDYVGELGWNVA